MTPLRDDIPNMVSEFRRAGYFTKAFSANPMLSSTYRTDGGFREVSWAMLDAEELAERASQWLRLYRREPFFLLVFILDPHAPYSPPADLRQRFARGPGTHRVGESFSDIRLGKSDSLTMGERKRVVDLYDAEIAWADRALSRILGTLRSVGLASRTVVAVTADHGEELWDHGGFFHGHSLYQELLHVPLTISVPWMANRGTQVDEPVCLLDLAPTLLELSKLEVPQGMLGRSLVPSLTGNRLKQEPCPAGAILYGDNAQALRLGQYKVMATPAGRPIALFDLDTDPDETESLIAHKRALAESLSSLLGPFGAAPAESVESVAPDEDTRNVLKALGYL